MKKLIIFYLTFFYLAFFCNAVAFAQLTLEECYSKAQANYPLIKQYDLIDKSKNYDLSNAGKGYLPQVTFSAKATYQSDVTQLPVDFSQLGIQGADIPVLSKDQYGVTVDLNQAIWDGGVIKSKKEDIRTSSDINRKNLEVELYSINDRVNQVFFGILLFDARMKQNRLYQEELQRNHDQVSSWIQNGIASQADLDAVKVEQLKSMQTESQLAHSRKAYLDILSALTGEELDSAATFVKPETSPYISASIHRPELDLYSARIKNLEIQNKAINAGLMPRLGIFLTGGYGKPGLNMLENEFSVYYIAGVNLSWNFSNLYSYKNNKQRIKNSITSVQTRQETFLFNINMDISRKQSEVNKYRDQLKYDDDIIALRKSIKQSSEAKMANGTLSGIDLMRDINSEERARQDKILHEIEMLRAIYNLKYVTN
ncbi:MAG: TolC family protein [Tannerella sp.]|jgi:outer membrane protein TolC|nr:TolC family protein [Tannerella sp.]